MLYVYFDYNDCLSQTELGVISNLLKQTISQLDLVPDSIKQLYEVSTKTNTNPERSVLLRQLLSCAERFDTVYVILDALDECDDSQQDDVLNLINILLSQSQFKIMLSSRPHLQRLQTLPESSDRIIISGEDIDADVRTYLISRLKRERFLQDRLRNKIVEVISEQAEGM